MARFFIEVYYKGTNYAGFQVQQNANTIQAEVEKALGIYFRKPFELTGSSRTDKGVHAIQNFFQADVEAIGSAEMEHAVYHLNAILPEDIVIRSVREVDPAKHARFDAKSRTYEYTIYQQKDPFLADRGFFYPYTLDISLLNEAARLVQAASEFKSFSKHNSQVKTFRCTIYESIWVSESGLIRYRVRGNRFLRGMVRGLVGTMLKVGRGKTSLDAFAAIIAAEDASLADFSVPPQGLTLVSVQYE